MKNDTPKTISIAPRKPGIFARIRGNFLAGLIIVAPIGLTFYFIWTIVGWVDGWVWPFIPSGYHPEALINRFFGNPENPISINVRGVGVVIFLVFTVLVGWIGKGLMGRSLIRLGERLVERMPVVRSIYNASNRSQKPFFPNGIRHLKKPVWSNTQGAVSGQSRSSLSTRRVRFIPSCPTVKNMRRSFYQPRQTQHQGFCCSYHAPTSKSWI